jgi:hypothetical protein
VKIVKMKQSIKAGLVALTLMGFVITTHAQSSDSKDVKPAIILSVGPDAGLPLGSFKDNYNWSIGGSIQGDFAIVKRALYVTVNAGYDNFFSKDNLQVDGVPVNEKDLQLIPVKAGLKYYPVKNLYIQGQAGVAILTNKSDVGADNSTVFAYSPQIGYLIPLGGKNFLDAGVKFESYAAFTSGGSSNNFLGLHVAYAFGL